jgi:calcium-dependent protein kinase
MYIMLSGGAPFYSQDKFELFELIMNGAFTFEAKAWEQVSDEGKELISRFLTVDPKQRITSEELKTNPWMTGDFTQPRTQNQVNVLLKLREARSDLKLI